MQNLDKDKEIKKYIKQYKIILDTISKDKKDPAQKIIKQIAFMEATLNELNREINTHGAVIETENARGGTTLSDIYIKTYNATIKSYNATLKALIDLMPSEVIDDSDELRAFKEKYK